MEYPYRLLSATRNSMALAAPSAGECSSGSTRKADVGIRLRANGKKKMSSGSQFPTEEIHCKDENAL